MTQMNPKEAFHNTAYSVQLPYIRIGFFKLLNNDNEKQSKNYTVI